MESKEKAGNSNEQKVVYQQEKGNEYKHASIFLVGTTVFLLCQLIMKGKNQQKTSSTEKFNTLADMTEREGEIHHDDTAESGKSDFEDDKI